MNDISKRALKASFGLAISTIPAYMAAKSLTVSAPLYFRYGHDLAAIGHIGKGAVATLVTAAIIDKFVLNSFFQNKVSDMIPNVQNVKGVMSKYRENNPKANGYLLVDDSSGEVMTDILTKSEFEEYKKTHDVTVISSEKADSPEKLAVTVAEYQNGKIRNDTGPAVSVFLIGKKINQIELMKSMDSFITNVEDNSVSLKENSATDLNFNLLARNNSDIINKILKANHVDVRDIKGVRSLLKFKKDVTKAVIKMSINKDYRDRVMNDIQSDPSLAPIELDTSTSSGLHNPQLEKEIEDIFASLSQGENVKKEDSEKDLDEHKTMNW